MSARLLVCYWLLCGNSISFAAEYIERRLGTPAVFIEAALGQDDTAISPRPDYWLRGTSGNARLRGNRLEIGNGRGGNFLLHFGAGTAKARGAEALGFAVHRYGGATPQWQRNVEAWKAVSYPGASAGIDVRIEAIPDGSGRTRIAMQARLAPQGDIANLQLRGEMAGLSPVVIDPVSGAASFNAPFFSTSLVRPLAWQERSGQRLPVDARFEVKPDGSLGVRLGTYQSTEAVTVGTAILQGSREPVAVAYAMDPQGRFYLGGEIESPEVCAVNPGGTQIACRDAWVAALRPDGSPIYFVRLSGKVSDSISGLAWREPGELLLLGNSESEDFPVSADALQASNRGPIGPTERRRLGPGGDLFLGRMDAADGRLSYASFYGGAEDGETGEFVSIGETVVVKVRGASLSLPATEGAWRQSADCPDVASCSDSQGLLRLHRALTRREAFTFLPRLGSTRATGAPDGTIFIDGWISTEQGAAERLPTTPGALQSAPLGKVEAYFVHLRADWSGPSYATFLGGPENDQITGVLGASTGAVHLILQTQSNGASNSDWLTLAADGRSLLQRRRIGESTEVFGQLLRSPEGRLFASGQSFNRLLNTSPEAAMWLPCPAGGASVPVLLEVRDDDQPGLRSYLPGISSLMRGEGTSTLPYVVFQNHRLAYEFRLDGSQGPTLACVTGGASRSVHAISPGQIITLAGAGLGPAAGLGATWSNGQLPRSLGGVQVKVNGVAAPLLYVSARQVNAIVPYESLPKEGASVVEVEYSGRILRSSVEEQATGVELFTIDFSGTGAAVALNQDGTLNSEANPAAPGSIVVLYGTGIGATEAPGVSGGVAPLSGPGALAKPRGEVIAFADQTQVAVLYAGAAPGLVNGAAQFNIRLPQTATGHVSIGIRINGSLPSNAPFVFVR